MSKTNDHKNSGEVNLFSILSHELKSSITLIQGLSELLKDNSLVGTNKELAQLVGYIHSTSNHTHKLLENVLNWSFLQNGNVSFKPQNVSVKGIVNHELEQLAFAIQHKELKLSCSVADEIIFADSHLLGMVIRNLLTNAIKYSYRGGAITLSLYIYLDFYEFTITDSEKVSVMKLNDVSLKVNSLRVNWEQSPSKVPDWDSSYAKSLWSNITVSFGLLAKRVGDPNLNSLFQVRGLLFKLCIK